MKKKLRAPYGPKQGCGTLGVSILVADIDWPVEALCEAGIQRLALSWHICILRGTCRGLLLYSSLIQKVCLLFISSITRPTSALPAESTFLLESTCPLDRFSDRVSARSNTNNYSFSSTFLRKLKMSSFG